MVHGGCVWDVAEQERSMMAEQAAKVDLGQGQASREFNCKDDLYGII